MKNLKVCRAVWVIITVDPAHDEFIDVTNGVYESEESAKAAWEELMADEEKQEGVRYVIEEVPLYLDYQLFSN